jgi:signal transduction histidine kinase
VTRRPVAWLLPAVALAAWVLAYALALDPADGQPGMPAAYLLYGVPYLAFAAVGGLVLRSATAGPVGWLLALIGTCEGLSTAATEVMRHLAGTASGRAVAGWLLVPVIPLGVAALLMLVLLLLVFPDGRLPSRRWRPFVAFMGVLVVVLVVQQLTSPTPSQDIGGLPASPLVAPAVSAALEPFTSFALFPPVVLVAAASLVVRYRRAGTVVRQQIKWLALAAVVLALCEAGNAALGGATLLSGVLDALGKLAVAAAVGIAVLRYRLFDVDLAISRGLAYGWLAVLVTALYVVLVVGAGSAIGRPAGPDLWLSLTATVVVALVSLPLRSRLQELANRLVYGRRQAPYESLAGFTRGLADRYAIGDVLPGVAAALGEGLRGRAAAVHLGDDGPAAAVWPPAADLPGGPADAVVPVSHRGEVLGSLSVWTHAPLTEGEQRLMSDLGTQAGLVVHNAALTAELERRLEELRASRLRLVTAQDGERRRFERDLHDGAQQDLVTLRMKLGHAERLVAAADPAAGELLAEVREHTAATLDSIRRLSRGLFPPLLRSHGLVPALVAHARRLPLPTEVRGSAGPLPDEVATAVWFCCTEALQNVVKHARASRAWVVVEERGAADGRELHVEVGDDGCGLAGEPGGGAGMQNMADRLEALGGRLRVTSGNGGTRVVGEVPLDTGPPVPAARSALDVPSATAGAG